MDGKLTVVNLVVANKERSLAFYTDQVGFEKKTDLTGPGGYRWVTVGPRGQELELAFWELGGTTDPSQHEAAKHWAPARAPPMVVQVRDCQKTYDELHGKGVVFAQPPMKHPWGTVATFQDPDGNLFSISELRPRS